MNNLCRLIRFLEISDYFLMYIKVAQLVQRVSSPLSPFPPLLTSSTTRAQLSQHRANGSTLLLINFYTFLWISPVSPQCHFSAPESHPWHPISFCCHVSLVPSVSAKFSDFPCFRWPWQFWAVLAKCFVEYPSIWICLMFSLWLDWGYGFEEEDHGDEVPFSSHHIKDMTYYDDLSLMGLTLGTQPW